MTGSAKAAPVQSWRIGNGQREADGAQGRRKAETKTQGKAGRARAARPNPALHLIAAR